MKKYKNVFSTFHTLHRLITASADTKNFLMGVCKIYKSGLNADRIILICRHANSHPFIRVRCDAGPLQVKKGGISILTRREKEILNQEKELITDRRLVHIFVFAETLGAIYIKRNPQKEKFSDFDKRWFTALSEVTTMGLKIFQLYREEHRTVMNSIKALTNMLKQYDSTSHLHTDSASRLIKAIAKEMKLTETQLRSLEYASRLHDAGAIQLQSTILKKHNRLTSDDYKEIRKHPREGVELIKNLEFLKPAIPIILHHHERYNGTGYPAQLKREEIPIGSRILAVLDAFDAMYFGRPYKKRKDLPTIIAELKKERGTQFDPKVIDSFLKIVQSKNIQKYLKQCRQ